MSAVRVREPTLRVSGFVEGLDSPDYRLHGAVVPHLRIEHEMVERPVGPVPGEVPLDEGRPRSALWMDHPAPFTSPRAWPTMSIPTSSIRRFIGSSVIEETHGRDGNAILRPRAARHASGGCALRR